MVGSGLQKKNKQGGQTECVSGRGAQREISEQGTLGLHFALACITYIAILQCWARLLRSMRIRRSGATPGHQGDGWSRILGTSAVTQTCFWDSTNLSHLLIVPCFSVLSWLHFALTDNPPWNKHLLPRDSFMWHITDMACIIHTSLLLWESQLRLYAFVFVFSEAHSISHQENGFICALVALVP